MGLSRDTFAQTRAGHDPCMHLTDTSLHISIYITIVLYVCTWEFLFSSMYYIS
jgi:hypothetical protein